MSGRQRTSSLIPNSFQTPNAYVDLLLPVLSGTEVKVVLFITRKTFGWGRAAEELTIAEIMAATGMSRGGVSAALNRLVRMRVIERQGERGQEFRYALQLDAGRFVLPAPKAQEEEGGCSKFVQGGVQTLSNPDPGPIQKSTWGASKKRHAPHPEIDMGTPYTLNPLPQTQEETHGEIYTAREAVAIDAGTLPKFPKPSQRLAAEQERSASWTALCDEEGGRPTPGLEHERRTVVWIDLQTWAKREGLDDVQLGREIVTRAGRYRRRYSTPYSARALVANWGSLALEVVAPTDAARASPEGPIDLAAAQPKRTQRNIAAGRRFLERHGDGQADLPGAPGGAGRRDEQGLERRADRTLVAEVRPARRGDLRGGD